MLTIKTVVVTTRARRHPHFLQRFLLVNNDLAVVGKRNRQHPTRALCIQIGICGVIDAIAALFYGHQQVFGAGQLFEVCHYNLPMLKAFQILASRRACAVSVLALVTLAACGQRGPLFMPSDVPASTRATLVQTLRPGGVLQLQPAAPMPMPSPVPALSAPVLSFPVPAAPLSAPSPASAPP